MKILMLLGQCALVAASGLLLVSSPAFSNENTLPASGGAAEHGRSFDWIEHTQFTLDELKVKLNLSPEQTAAWSTWSSGVLKDAHSQLDKGKSEHEGKVSRGPSSIDKTTPEQMASGIAQLRAETAWMQEHLVQLEAAQVRTKVFYDALNTNQKTIFDLFWHEMHHRMSGHDGGVGPRDGDADGGCMMGRR